jgi:hypothetical protein
MVSENATRLLAVLKKIPGGTLCVACAEAQFDLDRREMLKAMRELVGADHIIHGVFHCSCCGRAGVAALLRPSDLQSSA